MKKTYGILFSLLLISCNTPFFFSDEAFVTQFEKTNGEQGASYADMIEYYKNLASQYSEISFRTIGTTDNGEPLHIVIYNPESTFDFDRIRKDKTILLISNGICQNETEGIDATMLLMRNLAQQQIPTPENLVIVAIPSMTYQIPKDSLANQYTNAFFENYYLDDDFIKNDTRNALEFTDIYHLVQPNVFIDTRSISELNSSNAFFYQTIIPEKLGGMKSYLQKIFLPRLTDSLAVKKEMSIDSIPSYNQLLIPYPPEVSSSNSVSSSIGYTSLWQTFSLKIASQINRPYKERVEGMYNALKTIVSICDTDAVTIKRMQQEQSEKLQQQSYYAWSYEADSTQMNEIFVKDSTEKVIYPTHFKAIDSVLIPEKYIVPQSLKSVVKRLRANKIQLTPVEKDTILVATTYRLEEFLTSEVPIDGRYKHSATKVKKQKDTLWVSKGDFWIETKQKGLPYLLETLEPNAPESFFNWNFFDIILSPHQQDHKRLLYPIFRIE